MAAPAPPDKLSIVVYSGQADKVHYALATAAAALSVGRATTLFFTMDACRALGADQAWRALPVSQDDWADGAAMDAAHKAQDVGDLETLLGACVDMQAKFMVCEMGLQARALGDLVLRDDVPLKPGGLVTFLNDASKDGAILFV